MTVSVIFEQYDGDEITINGLLIVGSGDKGSRLRFPEKVKTNITGNIVITGYWQEPSRFERLLFRLRLKKPYVYKVIMSKEKS